MESAIRANQGDVHGEIGEEGAVEGGALAIRPVQRRTTGKKHTSLVPDRITQRNHGLGQLIVDSPQDCTDAVPPNITECAQGIKVWLYPDVILEEIVVCSKVKYAVYLQQEEKTMNFG